MASNKNVKSKENGIIAKFYILAYNLLQILGWCFILYKLINFYIGGEGKGKTLWESTQFAVIIFQNAAALEIIHAFTGLVKSNPITTTLQVLSRVAVVCGVLLATPPSYAQASPGLPLALTTWSITEIVRYSFYFTNIVGYVPHFLVWLRYSTFIILYPIGVTGEMLCFYAATKYASAHQEAWSYALPNAWNFTFSYHYLLIIIMLLYIPLFPQLYLHMFAQRKKVLGPQKPSSKKVQ